MVMEMVKATEKVMHSVALLFVQKSDQATPEQHSTRTKHK
jgi:hypothetical protein